MVIPTAQPNPISNAKIFKPNASPTRLIWVQRLVSKPSSQNPRHLPQLKSRKWGEISCPVSSPIAPPQPATPPGTPKIPPPRYISLTNNASVNFFFEEKLINSLKLFVKLGQIELRRRFLVEMEGKS